VPVGVAVHAVDALGNVLTSTSPARATWSGSPRGWWLATVVVLLAFIGIVVWSQWDALRNPETSKQERQ
jgi:hypothetical protein